MLIVPRTQGYTTKRVFPNPIVEAELLAKLQQDILSPEAIDYVFHLLEVALSKRLSGIDGNWEKIRRVLTLRMALAKNVKEIAMLISGLDRGRRDRPGAHTPWWKGPWKNRRRYRFS
jgi:glutamine synthetase type III